MASVKTTLEYLQDLPIYALEKPYWCYQAPRPGFDPDKQRLDNLEFEHFPVEISNLRHSRCEPSLERTGFEIMQHESRFGEFETVASIEGYRRETEQAIRQTLDAEFVKCYDSCLRKNITFERTQFDISDPLLKQGPAQGVHIDITYDSGPDVIMRYLSAEEQERYLKPGYRLRIVNTWRSLVPELKDRPLALCDGLSVSPDDLVPTDRIIPRVVGEVYFLKYNPSHRWYWLENQTPKEPFLFVMYDTKAGSHPRYCPHVSFVHPQTPGDAPSRESIETRSIVVTRDSSEI